MLIGAGASRNHIIRDLLENLKSKIKDDTPIITDSGSNGMGRE